MRYVLRAAILLIGLVLVLDALVLVGRGLWYTYEAYHDLLMRPEVERPLLPALEAVDMFFMALAFFIVAVGLVQLFVGDLPFLKDVSLGWMRVDNYAQLKLLLWDTFLVMLLVFFITRVFSSDTLGWEALVLPAIILMLTVSSFLLKKGKH
jgi:uncharacterized membrane protein YqhA